MTKVMLNSFWGKFGEADKKPQTRTLQNTSDWDKLMTDDSVIVKSVNVFNEDVLEVVTVKKEGACKPNVKGNIFVALFTTAMARLKLYDALDTLKERVLYYDTHSVIYRTKPDEVKLPLGKFLGQFTDELEGDHIDEFGAAGPKSYAYTTNGGKTECKSKGIKNNHAVKRVKCNSMLKHIQLELNNPQDRKRRLKQLFSIILYVTARSKAFTWRT